MYTNLRLLFRPVQPHIQNTSYGVEYEEVFPDEKLKDFIYCYWRLESRYSLAEPFFYRGVADGCVDIITHSDYPYNARIIGFSSTYNLFPLGTSFKYIGIRFLPAAFPSVFDICALELSERLQEFDMVLPEVTRQLGHIFSVSSEMNQTKRLLDDYFLLAFKRFSVTHDYRLNKALGLIYDSRGNLSTQRDLDVGLSSRQLRRLFEFYLGDSPKTFSRVIRFQKMLNARPSYESLKKLKFYYDYGYYDQAHFIKEFKTFYGVSPAMALRSA